MLFECHPDVLEHSRFRYARRAGIARLQAGADPFDPRSSNDHPHPI
jgi:hypothetical protein